MIKRFSIGILLLFLADQSCAQLLASPERAAANSLRKMRWEKAESKLRKALRKDSLNVVAEYLLSTYFFKADNPAFHIDSAYRQVMNAHKHYRKLSSRKKEKMRRFPVDSARLVILRERIDSAAFSSARNIHTEQGYLRFLETHPLANQRNEAMELRDEVAYLDAVNKNTHEAFLDFLNKYPMANSATDAKKKYERLLFEARTNDKQLASFENFLREFPETSFRKEIEQNIFELFTLSGEAERFISFLQHYPSSHLVKKAQDILFHILQEQEEQPRSGLTDSLNVILQLGESYLVPFLKNNKFGFIDKNGKEIIPPTLDNVNDEFKCGNITDDVIGLPDRVLAKNGEVIYRGELEEIVDLGTGFLKIRTGSCNQIIHKSGFVVDSCVMDGKVLGNGFLAIEKDSSWNIKALNGRALFPENFDVVNMDGNLVILKKNDQWFLFTRKQVAEASEKFSLKLIAPYDEVKSISHGLLFVKARSYQGILGQRLEEVIPFSDHILAPAFFGFTGHSADGYSIYSRGGKQSSGFDQIELHEPWVTVRKGGNWYLFDPEKQVYASTGFDSLRFEGSFVLGVNSDTLSIRFGDTFQHFKPPLITSFVPGKDSTSFLSLESEGKKTLYDQSGKKLFTVTSDQIQYAGQDHFIISKKEKKGLINREGKVVIPLEYDAIGSASNNVISVLKNLKFGLYNISERKLIKPQYDKNLALYTKGLATALKDGLYGFVDIDNKPNGTFEFEEIQYWNDTTALVKKNRVWMFYTIATQQIAIPNIKEIKMISDSPDEKLAIVRQENAFGVISNKRGVVIPLTFTDLVNVGSKEEPLYFTEKHVEEASVFVVIYYNKNGKFVRREVYEETEEYEKIYCTDN